MSEHTFKAESRNVEGKGASRRLRRAAYIPAIVYGGGAEPQPVQIEHEAVWLASQHGWFYSSILTLDMDGKQQQVLLRDMQRHPYKQLIMHLDFQRVDANETLRTKVQLRFVNQEKSPAGKTGGVVVMHELTEVEISCLPRNLPEAITVENELGDLVGRGGSARDLPGDSTEHPGRFGRVRSVHDIEPADPAFVSPSKDATDKGA